MSQKYISIRGAREHNLKNIKIDIPREKLVVITGVSGSGKSSLAFDTIYAEGQRRYVESLSAYARQFLELMQKPDFDTIDGLGPAIAIEQKTTSKNPRSTVGTVTEIYDYLRLLFARIGVPYSPVTGKPITAQTSTQIVKQIALYKAGTKLLILAPIIRGRKGTYQKELDHLRQEGFQRVRINGEIYQLDEATPALDKQKKHSIDVVVDRLVLKEAMGNRLADSIETALGLSDGLLYVEDLSAEAKHIFSTKFACPESGFTLDELSPRLFSFNSPFGACSSCDGIGLSRKFDLNLIIPDPSLSIAAGAIVAFKRRRHSINGYYLHQIEQVLIHYKQSMDTPWNKLDKKLQEILLYGSKGKLIPMVYKFKNNKGYSESNKAYEGILPTLERRMAQTESEKQKEEFSNYQTASLCPECHGKRLNEKALSVQIHKKTIVEITSFSIKEAASWFAALENHLTIQEKQIGERVIKELKARLDFLKNVGLDYLTLDRTSGTLSGGESQRIRLASQIGSGLTGVLYVLDEPSIGLHQRDNDQLLKTLTNLRDLGNSVIVVEHDEDAIRAADFLIDIGPGAGVHGGEIVASGTPREVFKNKRSETAAYLNGTRKIELPSQRRKVKKDAFLRLKGATLNNLKNVNIEIPLGLMTCVTGVSGSGKSSLILGTLYKILAQKINKSKETPGPYKSIEGLERIDKIIDIDQAPIGRTPRSNPATYTGAFSPIRDWFAALPEAKARGYKAGRFSFNVKGGRCEACAGGGSIKVEMHFLPDIYVTCDQCGGRRFNKETLEVRYKGKNIFDILDMTVEDACLFFKAIPTIYNKLRALDEVGLGYIKIGQASTTLSGGEAQRIKLAKELSKRATGKSFYILDEPTTGLHFSDIDKLLKILQRLGDQGNSVLIIEHNLDVIKVADYLIDLGPEGGAKGGEIVGTGTPEQLVLNKKSYTGSYLKKYL